MARTDVPPLAVDGLSVSLAGRAILRGISLSLDGGEMLGLIGPNGAGKTTLVRAVAGLLSYQGRIALEGDELAGLTARERARRLAYLPQEPTVHWSLPVREVIGLGRLSYRPSLGRPSPADEAAIARAAAATATEPFLERRVDRLSAGERGRVLLARALATDAQLLIADEPVAALDPFYQAQVMEILRQTAARGTAAIVVLHDLSLAAAYCDRLALLDRGRIAAAGRPRTVLTRKALREVYGVVPGEGTPWPPPQSAPWRRLERPG